MDGSMRQRLEACLGDGTKADRALAAYILARPETIPFETAATLAEKVGVSEATVGRFCRSLGYDNLKDLKQRLGQDFGDRPWLIADRLREFQDQARASENPLGRSLELEIAGLVADLERVSARHDDLLTNAAIRDYFGEVFWRVGPERLDKHDVMKAFRLSAGAPSFDYRKVGEAFRLIDSTMAPVIVAIEDEAKEAIEKLETGFLPPGAAARRLQRFLVQIPPKTRLELIARRDVRLICEKDLGDQFAVLVTEGLYRPDVGIHWEAADADDLDLLMV